LNNFISSALLLKAASCVAAELLRLFCSVYSSSSTRPAMAFFLSFLAFLINISSFLVLFTVIPIDFLFFSHFILAFCS